MLISHRIALDPNDVQATYFARAAGVARFAYNWALAEWTREYAAGGKPSEAALRRRLNSLKRSEFPWMLEVTKTAPQHAVKNLGVAFRRFFAGQGKYPKFKKKGVHDSFRADNGTDKNRPHAVETKGRRVKLPVVGWVRTREPLRFGGKILSAVVSRTADRWFVSLTVAVEHHAPMRENQAAGGVDLGVSRLATFSDGGGCEGPKALRKHLVKLKRLSRGLSRKIKGSKNRDKARLRLARLHTRIVHIRQDALHKLTTELVRRYTILGIEDLNVRGMMANERLARSIADMGFHEFRRQLEYKAAKYGSRIVVADRWFASSKRCSECGAVLDVLALSARQWDCPTCGAHHDRDVNAAINLRNLAVSSTVSACGESGSGLGHKARVKPVSWKQEPSVEATYA